MNSDKAIELVVIGASWGGIDALSTLLSLIKVEFTIPIVVVLHQYKNHKSEVAVMLDAATSHSVREVGSNDSVENANVYIAAPNYHLLIESDKTFSLSVSQAVNYCRPSIDVLFESAADVYRDALACIVLTGANDDGARGAEYAKKKGGIIIVQDPEEAEMNIMPQATIEKCEVDIIADLQGIANHLTSLAMGR